MRRTAECGPVSSGTLILGSNASLEPIRQRLTSVVGVVDGTAPWPGVPRWGYPELREVLATK